MAVSRPASVSCPNGKGVPTCAHSLLARRTPAAWDLNSPAGVEADSLAAGAERRIGKGREAVSAHALGIGDEALLLRE
jgi:hypothetical protein